MPVGVPAPGATALTVAVKTTDWPNADGFTNEVTVVELLARLTVWVMAVEVLPLKLLSPPYVTVIVWLPTESNEVANVALPALKLAVPNVAAPSRNVTVPVGVPVAGATALTVAVKVTAWPKTDGFTDEVTVVKLLALFTVCVMAEEVLLAKFVSPA